MRTGRGLSVTIEAAVLLVAPLLLLALPMQQARFLALYVLAGYCVWRLVRSGHAATYLSFNWAACRKALPGILLRAAIAWVIVAAFVLLLYPGRFLCFASSRPLLLLGIVAGYSVASVIPQEIAFRSYARFRFDALGWRLLPAVLTSAALFGWVHIIFGSWLSVLLAFFAGISFYLTYNRTRSLAAVWLEHSLFGAAVFTLGLDELFYQGPFFQQFVPACA